MNTNYWHDNVLYVHITLCFDLLFYKYLMMFILFLITGYCLGRLRTDGQKGVHGCSADSVGRSWFKQHCDWLVQTVSNFLFVWPPFIQHRTLSVRTWIIHIIGNTHVFENVAFVDFRDPNFLSIISPLTYTYMFWGLHFSLLHSS